MIPLVWLLGALTLGVVQAAEAAEAVAEEQPDWGGAEGQRMEPSGALVDEAWRFRLEPWDGHPAVGERTAGLVDERHVAGLRRGDGGLIALSVWTLPAGVDAELGLSTVWKQEVARLTDGEVMSTGMATVDGERALRTSWASSHGGQTVRRVSIVVRRGDYLFVLDTTDSGPMSEAESLLSEAAAKVRWLDGPLEPRTRELRLQVGEVSRIGYRVRDGWLESAAGRLRLRPPPGWQLELPDRLVASSIYSVGGARHPATASRFYLSVLRPDGRAQPALYERSVRGQSAVGWRRTEHEHRVPGVFGPVVLRELRRLGKFILIGVECAEGRCLSHYIEGQGEVGPALETWQPEWEWLDDAARAELAQSLAQDPLDVRILGERRDWTLFGRTFWHGEHGVIVQVPTSNHLLVWAGAELQTLRHTGDLLATDVDAGRAWAVAFADGADGLRATHEAWVAALPGTIVGRTKGARVARRSGRRTPLLWEGPQEAATAYSFRVADRVVHVLDVHPSDEGPDVEAWVSGLLPARKVPGLAFVADGDLRIAPHLGLVLDASEGGELRPQQANNPMAHQWVLDKPGWLPHLVLALPFPSGTRTADEVVLSSLRMNSRDGAEPERIEEPCPRGGACYRLRSSPVGTIEQYTYMMGHGRLAVVTDDAAVGLLSWLSESEWRAWLQEAADSGT